MSLAGIAFKKNKRPDTGCSGRALLSIKSDLWRAIQATFSFLFAGQTLPEACYLRKLMPNTRFSAS